jgi:hypothetical protein
VLSLFWWSIQSSEKHRLSSENYKLTEPSNYSLDIFLFTTLLDSI